MEKVTFQITFPGNNGTVEIRSLVLPSPFILNSGGDLVCDVIFFGGVRGEAIEDRVYSVKWYKDGHEFYR